MAENPAMAFVKGAVLATKNDGLGSTWIIALSLATALTAAALRVIVKQRNGMAKHKDESKGLAALPSPPNSHWLFGDFKALNEFMHTSADGTSLAPYTNEYGQLQLQLVNDTILLVCHIEDVNKVLAAEHVRQPPPFVKKHASLTLGEKSVGIVQGKEWRMHRSAIYRAMTPSSLRQCRADMISVSHELVSSLTQKLSDETSSTGTVSMDLEPLLKMITIDIFAKSTLSVDLNCCKTLTSSPIAKAFDFLMDEISRRMVDPFNPFNFFYGIPTPLNRRHAREREVVRAFLTNVLEQHRGIGKKSDGRKKADLLDHLIAAHEQESSAGGGKVAPDLVSNQMLNDTLMTLVFAGYDTTSITLTYALYCISQDEDVERRCVDEIRGSLARRGVNADQEIDEEEASDPFSNWTGLDPEKDLVYCRAVLMETLRLYPPGAATTRLLQKPLQLQGNLIVPQNTRILIPIGAIQRDPRHYGENAHQFCPDRWLDNKTSSKKLDPKVAFLAFSAGGRSCPGQKFAMQEASLVLAVLLHHFSFRTLPDYELQPVRKGIVQHPKGGLPMKISARK